LLLLLDAVLNGIVLGGLYALIAIGLNLQYGVARIMNLSYGQALMFAGMSTFWLFSLYAVDPLVSLLVTVPLGFALSWIVYMLILRPLVRRSPSDAELERNSILVTFGLVFVFEGLALLAWGGDNRAYSWLARPIDIGGMVFAANRLVAFAAAVVLAGTTFALLQWTRIGLAFRAIAIDARAARLVSIDVARYGALAFAVGGAMAAAAGSLVSTFLSAHPTVGVTFTIKGLIVTIMGGIGNISGGFVAALILGVAESLGGAYIDPALTLAINFAVFLAILLWRPEGLFRA
jgi:branched-chain amino acid transport system permease protein